MSVTHETRAHQDEHQTAEVDHGSEAPAPTTRFTARGTIPPVESQPSSGPAAQLSASERAVFEQRQAIATSRAEDVQARSKKQVPGAATVRLENHTSEAGRLNGLEAALHGRLGIGDDAGFDAFVHTHEAGMYTFVQALAGGSGQEHPTSADFYRLAMVGLHAVVPGASFELVLGDGPQPLIAATTKQGVQTFRIDETAMGRQGDLVNVVKASGLAGNWYTALHTMHTREYARHDRGTAERSLADAQDHSIGVDGGAIAAAILRMAPSDQLRFLQELQHAAGGGPDAPMLFGGLVVRTQTPAQPVATAPADHLATGQPAPERSAVTVSLDGVAQVQRNHNFVDRNYKAVVEAQLSRHLLRGTEPRTLVGHDVENEVGMALGEQPTHLPRTEQDAAKLDAHQWDAFAGNHRVEAIANKIRDKGGHAPSVTLVPILFDAKTKEDLGVIQFPLFSVGGCLIDHVGRVYDSVEDWRHHNTLPAGRISYPAHMELHESSPGDLAYTTEDTHAKHPSNKERVEAVLDEAALVGGIVLGGAAILGTGGAAAAAGGAVTALYGMARAGEALEDRADHEQTIDPLRDGAARSAWLDIGSSALALATMGTTAALGEAARGTRIVSGVSKIADIASNANTANELRAHWSEMSPGERASIALQLGFWGAQQVAAHVQAADEPVRERSDEEPHKKLFHRAPRDARGNKLEGADASIVASFPRDEQPAIAGVLDEVRTVNRESLRALVEMPGFQQLTAGERVALLRNLLADSASGRGAGATQLYERLTDSGRPIAEEARVNVMRTWISAGKTALAWSPEPGTFPQRQHAQVHETAPDRFQVGAVEIVKHPDSALPPGYRYPTPAELQYALDAQLPGTLDNVRRIYLTSTPYEGGTAPGNAPARAPEDKAHLALYRPSRDIIQIRPMEIVRDAHGAEDASVMRDTWTQTLAHELGHALDADRGVAGAYDQAIAADGNAVSRYGLANSAEDLAETYSLYVQVLGTPREASMRALYGERFAYLDQLTGRRA